MRTGQDNSPYQDSVKKLTKCPVFIGAGKVRNEVSACRIWNIYKVTKNTLDILACR